MDTTNTHVLCEFGVHADVPVCLTCSAIHLIPTLYKRRPCTNFGLRGLSNYQIASLPAQADSIKLVRISPTASVSCTVNLTNDLDWDLEIRKRYQHPLFQETLEFPDAPAIQNRMLPICYEEALPNGPADQCAEFVATATEMFIKDVVGSVISLTRNNFLSNVRNGFTNGKTG